MYYIILFLGVLTFLAVVAWLDPSRRPVPARGVKLVRPATVRSSRTVPAIAPVPEPAPGSFAALLKGERKEDKPCITPIDCVMEKRCAGHCGHR